MAWNGWKVIDMDSHIVERPRRCMTITSTHPIGRNWSG